jgi:hypothetical protein
VIARKRGEDVFTFLVEWNTICGCGGDRWELKSLCCFADETPRTLSLLELQLWHAMLPERERKGSEALLRLCIT